jgi:hypothetical protein
MFLLHDHSRRALCRFGFVLLCLVPTATVLAWGLGHHLPSHIEAACREVTAWTRCPAEIGNVTHPRPGVTILHELILKDVATTEAILRLDQLKIEDRGGSLRIVATRPRVSIAGLPRLWQALAGHMDAWSGEQPLEFFAGTLDLESAGNTFAFQDVQARLHAADAGPALDAQLRHAGMEAIDPAELHLMWNRGDQSLRYDLATGPTPFPCGMASALAPELAVLGPGATFQGRLSVQRTRQGWQGLIGPAQIVDIELEPLVRDYSGRRLTGRARLDLELLRVAQSAIATVDGELRSGPGGIDATVIYSLGDALGVMHVLPSDRRALTDTYLYGELAVGFSINSQGVLLSGKCTGADGMLLTDHHGNPIAREPAGRCSVDALVRALTPASAGYVPATRQAERLLKRLPLSEDVPTTVPAAPAANR